MPVRSSLHAAVEQLLQRPKLRIQVTAASSYTVTAPCLLQQLVDAIGASSSGSGGRTVPGSRLPVATDALDLMTEITFDVNAWAALLGVDRARYRQPQPAPAPPPVGRLLRAVAAAAAGRPDRQALADRVEHNARRWSGQITAMLTPKETRNRGLNGVPCDGCGTAWVADPEQRADGHRVPAVWVEFGDTGLIRCLWCRACGRHTWRDQLTARAGAA